MRWCPRILRYTKQSKKSGSGKITVICPSCGFEKDYPEKPVCKYCYYRGTTGASKMILFQSMQDNGNKYLTIDELTELVNNNPNKKNKVTRHAVYKIIHRYSKYYEHAKIRRKGYLVLVKDVPRKKGQMGRTQKKYRLSSKLAKRVDFYERRWMAGLPINGKVNKGEKFKMKVEYGARARAISQKLRKNEYDKYEYLFV